MFALPVHVSIHEVEQRIEHIESYHFLDFLDDSTLAVPFCLIYGASSTSFLYSFLIIGFPFFYYKIPGTY